jgi:molybdopterin/thiamine biosynthesis adenylyltransferase
MPSFIHHEQVFRGKAAMAKLAAAKVALCGAGAVGSNLAVSLARQGFRGLEIIDFDRVEQHNLSTQDYVGEDIGAKKADALANRIYDICGVEVGRVCKRLEARNARKLLSRADLIVDGFDNHEARALVTVTASEPETPCVHVGLAAEFAEVRWNEDYRVPRDPLREGAGLDICDYPLARNLVLLAVSIAAEAIVRLLLTQKKEAYELTLGDLHISSRDG